MIVEVRAETEAEPALVEAVREDAEALLHAAKLEDVELSMLLTDDPGIQALNATWRGKDSPTDVLSFPQDDEIVLGDLVISLPTAGRQADERGTTLRDELRVLTLHGLLHLLGYDHEHDEAEAAEMAEAEGRLMGQLGWVGQGLIAAAHEGWAPDAGSDRQGDPSPYGETDDDR